jgi:hypothetical protein
MLVLDTDHLVGFRFLSRVLYAVPATMLSPLICPAPNRDHAPSHCGVLRTGQT